MTTEVHVGVTHWRCDLCQKRMPIVAALTTWTDHSDVLVFGIPSDMHHCPACQGDCAVCEVVDSPTG